MGAIDYFRISKAKRDYGHFYFSKKAVEISTDTICGLFVTNSGIDTYKNEVNVSRFRVVASDENEKSV